jgi:hypothetical protein
MLDTEPPAKNVESRETTYSAGNTLTWLLAATFIQAVWHPIVNCRLSDRQAFVGLQAMQGQTINRYMLMLTCMACKSTNAFYNAGTVLAAAV